MGTYRRAVSMSALLVLAACGGGGGGGAGPEPEVASVIVSPDDLTLPVGQSEQLTATVEDEDGNPLAGRTITWASSNAGVATVSPTGLVSAVGPGAATLSATSEGKSGNASIDVFVPVATVAVSPGELVLIVGAPRPLKATARDESGQALPGRPITWATSDPSIAIVSAAGVVTGLAPGSATITATSEGKSGSAAVSVGPPVTFASLAAGGAHTCALTAAGVAYCWGRGESGQLGIPVPASSCITDAGPFPCSMVPVPVGGSQVFAQLAAGGAHTCGLTADGTAWCWGRNDYGQLGDNSVTSGEDAPVPVATALKFTSIDAGTAHTCGLTAGGAAWCWGRNDRGQLGDGTTMDRYAPVTVTGAHEFDQISLGGFSIGHTCGVAGGTVYCWGDNEKGQLGNGSGGYGQEDLSPHPDPAPVSGGFTFAAVAAGLGQHTCAVTGTGAAFCWGDNSFGMLGDGSGTDSPTPVPVSGGLELAQVITGGYIGHTCGRTTAGTAWCWGEGSVGQLGNGSRAYSWEPTPVAGGHAFTVLDAGFRHTCGLATTGSLYCWGSGGAGQLGINADDLRTVPTKVLGQP